MRSWLPLAAAFTVASCGSGSEITGTGGQGGSTGSTASSSATSSSTGSSSTGTSSSGTGGLGTGGMGTGGMGTGGMCTAGQPGCPCAANNGCDPGAACIDGTCQSGCCGGYAEMGGQCVWGGGTTDPGFSTTTAWTTTGLAVINPTAAGVDPGTVAFSPTANCKLASVGQTYSSPQLTCAAGPLLLELAAATACNDPIFCPGNAGVGLGVGVDGAWHQVTVPSSGAWKTQEVCLGSRALGGTTSLVLSPLTVSQVLCSGAVLPNGFSFALDQVTIGPDTMGACPPLGTVPNGDFEGGAAPWQLTSSPGSTAVIAAGLGNNGSAGAHLGSTSFCSAPSMSGAISIPDARLLPSPALRIWSKASTSTALQLTLGNYLLSTLGGTGTGSTKTICLPHWTLGTVQTLTFLLREDYQTTVCANPYVRDAFIDDLAFVSEPSCDEAANVLDPGFEQLGSTTLAPSWTPYWYVDQPGASVAIVSDASLAHSGSAAAVFKATQPCRRATLDISVTIPPPDANGGPTLSFWYRSSPAASHLKIRPVLRANTTAMSLGASNGWQKVDLCLPAAAATHPDELTFTADTGSSACATPFPEETITIDDVSLGTSPGCPSQ